MEIREAISDDAAALATIYNHYVERSTITFEEHEISAEDMAARMGAVQSLNMPWYVAVERRITLGYAFASMWKSRSAYRFASEGTVYVAHDQSGKGVGSALYGRLIPTLKNGGLHTVLAGIALPNQASISLHERFGFRKVAHLSQVGFKLQQWIDVGYWQLVFDEPGRSSPADQFS